MKRPEFAAITVIALALVVGETELERLGWSREVLTRTGQLPTLSAKLRWVWWRHVRRYNCEVCHRCGRPVGRELGSWWHAPDELWSSLGGPTFGVLCPACFTALGDAQGKLVYWMAGVAKGSKSK